MEVHIQQDIASNGVTLDRIHAHGKAYYLGWELSAKVLGGIDGEHGRSLLDRIQSPDGKPGWRVMTPHEWAVTAPGTNAVVGDNLQLPLLVEACRLRPLLEDIGLTDSVVSALVDVPASPDMTEGTCHEVSPDDGSPGYTLRVEKVTLPLDTSSPPTIAGITLQTPHQLEGAAPTCDPSTSGSSESGGPVGIPKMPVRPRKHGMSRCGAASKGDSGDVPVSYTEAACRSTAQGVCAVPQGSAQLRRASSMSLLPTESREPAQDAEVGLRITAEGQCLSHSGREAAGMDNCGTSDQAGKCSSPRGRHRGSEGHHSPGSPDLSSQAEGDEGRVVVESVELPDVGARAGEPVVVHVIHTQGGSFCVPAELAISALGRTPRKGWLNVFKAASRGDGSSAWQPMSADELAAVKEKVNFTGWGPFNSFILDVAYLRSIESLLGAHAPIIDYLENALPEPRVPRDVNNMAKRMGHVTGSRGGIKAATPSAKKSKVSLSDHNSTEVRSQPHNAPAGVTLDRIHANGDAYYLGWELSLKLLGGIDGDSARPLLDRLQSPDGLPGWRGMTPHEWAALPSHTSAGVGDSHLMPVLVKACCLRPLLEEMGFDAAVVSELVDAPASSDKTKGTCHEVSPDDGSPGYLLRVEQVSVPLDAPSPATLAGVPLRTLPAHRSEGAEPGLPLPPDPSRGGSSKSGGPAGIRKMPVLSRKHGMSERGAALKGKTGGVPVSHTEAACRSNAPGACNVPQVAAQTRRASGISPVPIESAEPARDAGVGPGTTTDSQRLRDTGREVAGTSQRGALEQPGKGRVKRGRNCGSEEHHSPASRDLPEKPAAVEEGGVLVESVELPDMETPAGNPPVVHVIHTQGASFAIAAQLGISVLGQTPRKGWLNMFKAARCRDGSSAWRYMSVDELAAVKGKVNFTSWGAQSTLMVDLAYLGSIKSAFGKHSHVIHFLENLQSKRRLSRDVKTVVKRTRLVTGSRGDAEAAAPTSKIPKPRSKKVEPPPPTLIDGEEHWEVDQILDHRTARRAAGAGREFLVSWKGWGPEDNSWEPEEHLAGSKSLLREYLKRL